LAEFLDVPEVKKVLDNLMGGTATIMEKSVA
jgi:hypothetical protein